jgi:hypothetical protein
MAIYEVTLNSTYYGQNCLNRWNYIAGGIPAAVQGSFGLAFAFGFAQPVTAGTIYNRIKLVSSSSVIFTGYRVVNLYDPEDFYSTPFGSAQNGDIASEGMPPFASYGFRSNQVTLAVARGTKRLVGVVESASLPGGGVLGTTLSSQLTPLAAAMGEVLTYEDEGNTVSYSPAILSRQEYAPSPGKVAYRKYPTEAEQLEHAAIGISWEPYNTVRSQVSRQYGRGA